MDDLIKVLISKDNWLALWLAYMIWRDITRERQYAANVNMFVEVARNSTTAIMAFTEMMKSRKEKLWGEQFDEDFHAAQERAQRRLGESAP